MSSETTQSAPLKGRVATSRNKKRCTSESSASASTTEQQDGAMMLAPSQVSSTMHSPERGSSREMSPLDGEGSVRYTRTGRISRASKGQRVHQCEECGKVYTRAEHLRRHQQNHKPGAFPCDIPGCNRSFYREDLLVRHKSRQHDSPGAGSARLSPASRGSSPPAERSSLALLPTLHSPPMINDVDVQAILPQSTPPPHPDGASEEPVTDPRIQKVFRSSVPQSQRQQQSSVIVGDDGFDLSDCYSDSSPVPYPLPCDVDRIPYSPHMLQARQSFGISFPEHYPTLYQTEGSTSPEPTVDPLAWGHSPSVGFGTGTLGAFTMSQNQYSNTATVCNGMTDAQLMPELRDLDELAELEVPIDSPRMSPFDTYPSEPADKKEQEYLRMYWSGVHTSVPVMHRPSFDRLNTSPLLKAAILALGANAFDDPESRNYARLVHARCSKVLHKRTMNESHSFRICDMQAIILIEIYSIFKSRRPPVRLSKLFERVYDLLIDVWETSERITNACAYGQSLQNNARGEIGGVSSDSVYSYAPECKQRLLVSCYILDQQHALLFGRPRVRHIPESGGVPSYLRSLSVCDAVDESQTTEELLFDSGWATPASCFTPPAEHDEFRSLYLLAVSVDSKSPDRPNENEFGLAHGAPFAQLLHESPSMQLAYNTLMLCKTTPICDLLAVVGESWIMSEKLTSPDQYAAAQRSSLNWARAETVSNTSCLMLTDQRYSVRRAVSYALQVLKLHRGQSAEGVLFHEWSLYLASLVIWASAYADSNGFRRESAPSKTSAAPVVLQELDGTVSSVLTARPPIHLNLDAALNILGWTKDRLQAGNLLHHCGLASGALDVLSKLIARGSEVGWFGS